MVGTEVLLAPSRTKKKNSESVWNLNLDYFRIRKRLQQPIVLKERDAVMFC